MGGLGKKRCARGKVRPVSPFLSLEASAEQRAFTEPWFSGVFLPRPQNPHTANFKQAS